MSNQKLNDLDVLDTEQPLVTDNKHDSIEEITLEQLPEHILEKIINYLPKKDILALTLVNKALNGFISNNTCIMKNFVMVFPNMYDLYVKKYNFPSIRKYSNWNFKRFFSGDEIAIAAKFLKRYGSHVKQITIKNSFVARHDRNLFIDEKKDIEMIVTVLKICNNVEVLSIKRFPSKPFKYENLDSLPSLSLLPHLKQLKLTCTAEIEILLHLFKDFHLKSLSVDWYNCSNSNLNLLYLQNFLKNQPNLEHLDFIIDWDDIQIENGEVAFLLDTCFKLKSLNLNCRYGSKCLESQQNTWKFINAQKDTLQKLEVCGCSFYFFNGFPHVKHLKINFDTNFSNLLMESVKILTVMRYGNNQRILTPFAQNFPNLQEIKLEYFTIRFDILQNLPEVSKLSLIRCRLVHVSTFTKLKSLEIRECDIENQTFDWNGNQLKELIIEKGHHDWIENFLNHKDTNLNYLRLIGQKYTMQLNPQLHEIINNNIHKIKYVSVDMYDPSGVTDEIHLELNDNGYETSDSESNDSDANVSGDDEN